MSANSGDEKGAPLEQCRKRACNGAVDFAAATNTLIQQRLQQAESKTKSSTSHSPDSTKKPSNPMYPKVCPPDSARLGKATWTFLHTMAEYFPDQPSTQEQEDMGSFMRNFAKFYPCDYCAKDLRRHMREHPVDTSSRARFALWMCEAHNEVNRKLGKPEFDCSKTAEAYRDGPSDGSCD